MKRVSLKAGLSESGVRDIVNRGATPSIDTFVAIAKAVGVEPAFLLQGDERFSLKVPKHGIVGAESWHPLDDASQAIQFSVADLDLIGLAVEGDGMAPAYRNGDFLICRKHLGKHLHNLIGLDCAVRTVAGAHYLKILKKGTRANTFNLRSYKANVDDIENVQLDWAAPVMWVRRAVNSET